MNQVIKLSIVCLLSLLTARAISEPFDALSIGMLGQKSDVEIRLYVLDCGKVLTRDLSIFSPGVDKGIAMEMAVPCYFIKHPNGKTLVWDAGINDEIAKLPTGMEYGNGAFNLSVSKTMSSQLKALGVNPEEITYFAPSHLHIDHAGNANYFKHSTLLIQKVEFEVAFSEHAAMHGFNINDYHALKEAKRIELIGDHDVFGDGSVIILSTPGHSIGHQSLFVKLKKAGPLVLSGDLYHFQKNREHYRIPIWNDKKSTVSSFARMDKILTETKAKFWIQHDMQQDKMRKKSPAFYD